jgi:hypothetical protein
LPLEIIPKFSVVPLGNGKPKTIKFKAKLNGKPVDADWELDSKVGEIWSDGEYFPPDEPVSGHPTVTVRAKASDGGKRVTGMAEVKFRLVWPKKWPYLAEPNLPMFAGWEGEKGRRAALVLYDLLLQLPDTFLRRVENVPIFRVPKAERPFHFPFPTAFVVFEEGYLEYARGEVRGSGKNISEAGSRELAMAFLHELAHAAMTDACGGPDAFGKLIRQIVTGGAAYGLGGAAVGAAAGGAVAGVAAGAISVGWMAAAPVLPLLLIAGLTNYGIAHAGSWDTMSDYAQGIGWETDDTAALSIPLLGLLLWWLRKVPPNVVTGFRYIGWAANLHHPKITPRRSQLKDPENPDLATRTKISREVGTPSYYATEDPHEDFAEAVCAYALGAQQINTFRDKVDAEFGGKLDRFQKLSAFRSKFLVDEGFFPNRKAWRGVTLEKALGSYDGWDIEVSRNPDRDYSDEVANLQRLIALLEGWGMGAGTLIEGVREILKDIKPVDEEPTGLGFLRVAEKHGDGVRRYGSLDSEKGDVLVDREGALWIVLAVKTTKVKDPADPKKTIDVTEVTDVTGGPIEFSFRDTKEWRLQGGAVLYQWRPDKAPRQWLSPGTPAPAAYKDVNAFIAELVGWWGRTETPKPVRDIAGMGAFFAAALDLAGVRDPKEFALPDEATTRDVIAYLRTHGEGLRVYDAGGARPFLEVGDWVLLYHRQLLGLVTRVDDADNTPVDILVGGARPDGLPVRNGSYMDVIGHEPSFAVTMLHGVDPWDVQWIWKPAQTTRRFTMMPTDFLGDPDRGFNNLLDHTGRDTIQRDGEREWVSHKPMLMLLWLMVERGGTAAAMATMRGILSIHGRDDDDLLRFIYAHGEPTGRAQPKVGDLVVWKTGNVTRRGVVLEVDGKAATQLVSSSDVLDQVDEKVEASQILESWTPTLQPRTHDPMVAAFYGAPSILFDIVQSPDRRSYRGDKGRKFDFVAEHEFAHALADRAPLPIRDRLQATQVMAGVAAAADTFGAGLVRYKGQTLEIGTWLFLKNNRLAVLLSVSGDGTPLRGISPVDAELQFIALETGDIVQVWTPSVIPFDYSIGGANGYVDINGAVGELRFRAAIRARADEVFVFDPLLAHLDPDLAAFLRRGPTDPDRWADYLADAGTVETASSGEAGDFLFLDSTGHAVAVSDKEMVTGEGGTLALRKLAKVQRRWRFDKLPS